jgi:hypothetical protein
MTKGILLALALLLLLWMSSCTDGAQWEQRGEQWCLRYYDDLTAADGLYCRVEPGPLLEPPNL